MHTLPHEIDFVDVANSILEQGFIDIAHRLPFVLTEVLKKGSLPEYPIGFYENECKIDKIVGICQDNSPGILKSSAESIVLPIFNVTGSADWDMSNSRDDQYMIDQIKQALQVAEDKIFNLVFECLVCAAKTDASIVCPQSSGYYIKHNGVTINVEMSDDWEDESIVMAVRSFNIFSDETLSRRQRHGCYFRQEMSFCIFDVKKITLV